MSYRPPSVPPPLPPRPAQQSAFRQSFYNSGSGGYPQEDAVVYDHLPPPPPAQRPRADHSARPPPPIYIAPAQPSHAGAHPIQQHQGFPEKQNGYTGQRTGRKRWLPVTRAGKCILWTLVLSVVAVLAAIIAVAVVFANRNSSSSGNNGNRTSSTTDDGPRPPPPAEPTASRIPSDYINHPVSAEDGGVNTTGRMPVYGENVMDHFVIHSPRMVGLSRLDPIVSPGKVAQHAHRFHGSSLVTPDLHDSQYLLDNANCSTVFVQDDKSQYWLPQLYVRLANGTNIAAPIRQASTYYFSRAPSADRIYPFPDNYNIVAGDPYRRYPAENETVNARYTCYLGTKYGATQTLGFPNSRCPDGLIEVIIFPSCWDGVYAQDGKYADHVTYPKDGSNGFYCPNAFPYKFMTLQFEVVFNVGPMPYNGDGQTYMLANGDTTGYGIHADFVNGWHPSTLLAVTEVCRYLNKTEDLKGPNPVLCPALNRTHDPEAAKSCRWQSTILNEDVGYAAPIARLPGCNEVWSGNDSKPTCNDGRGDGGVPDMVQPSRFYLDEPLVGA